MAIQDGIEKGCYICLRSLRSSALEHPERRRSEVTFLSHSLEQLVVRQIDGVGVADGDGEAT